MKSNSPFSETFEYEIDRDNESQKVRSFAELNRRQDRQIVAVQGLGFVGTGMVAALTQVRNSQKELGYGVIGVDLPDESNYWKIARTNRGKPARIDSDLDLNRIYENGVQRNNLLGTYSLEAYRAADIVVVDIPLDVRKQGPGRIDKYDVDLTNFRSGLEDVAERICSDTLVVIETTVPPGTTEQVVKPIFEQIFSNRGLEETPKLAHSYERVMPGDNYLESITDYYRVFAGLDEESSNETESFLKSFINTEDFPLTELESPTASEMAKVLENSYRAANIAFIQEWTEFAELAGIDLFRVIEAIQQRESHKNIRWPGFGVGGYCLPEDPLLADWSFSKMFGGEGRLPVTTEAVEINDFMPLYTWQLMEKYFELTDRTISILGVAYLGNTSDTRSSPTQLFYDRCVEEGLDVFVHDPFVSHWPEREVDVANSRALLGETDHDIVVLTTRHNEYLKFSREDFDELFANAAAFVDANHILSEKKRRSLQSRGKKVVGVGKGHWNNQ